MLCLCTNMQGVPTHVIDPLVLAIVNFDCSATLTKRIRALFQARTPIEYFWGVTGK